MIGYLIGLVLVVFQFVLIARMIVDWVAVLSPGAGGGALDGARRVTHALTEPVIAPVRARVKPVRFGSFGLDLAFMIVFFGVLLLRLVVVPLIPF